MGDNQYKGKPPPRLWILSASCMAIFWPGTLVFGFPGVMGQHWKLIFDIGGAEAGRILFFILAPVGCFMFFFGKLLERWRPQTLIVMGTLLGVGSTMLLPLATSFTGVYLWAFAMGSSTAMIYLTGLTVTQHWYPEHRGLISGIYNLSFGGSAALLSPVYSLLLNDWGYSRVTFGAALCLLCCGLISALFIRFPPPKHSQPSSRSQSLSHMVPASMKVADALKTRSFWFLWLTWAFAGAAGISMVMLSTAYGKARGLSTQEAVLLLTAFNVTNGASRLISGYVSDLIGRRVTLALSFFVAAAAYFIMDLMGSPVMWMVLCASIGYAFGTLFAVSAPLVGECFGMDHFGAIIGVVFTAYGFVAGVIGPWLSGYLLDVTEGNFEVIFCYLGTLYLLSVIMIMLTRPQTECIVHVR